MYSRQEESILRKRFWTGFGQYLAPVPAASGNKVNWINYKSGIKHIYFKMNAERKCAYIAVEITHKDHAAQQKCFQRFKTLRSALEGAGAGEWTWETGVLVDDKKISRIYQVLHHVNVYNKEDWPQIISFLKTGIIALDDFWNGHKDIFEMAG